MDEQLTELLAKQTQILEYLATKEGMHTKVPATTGTFTGIYQPGGMFSVPGTDRDVFSTHIRPVSIANALPLLPGNEDSPRYATLTGISDDIGDRPVNPCDDAPSGYVKGCYLTARFGRVSKDTETVEWDQVKRKANRGVFDDLLLHGRLLGLTDLTPGNVNEADMLNIITMSEMIQAAVRLERDLTVQMWQGNPAVATAGGGYAQFPGLDLQIATGQLDAQTGAACPSLDSDVKDFAYNAICGVSPSIVQYMSTMEWYLRFIASRTGLDPISWVWVMNPTMWQELTACWPCQYNTNRCANSIVGAGSRVFIDGRENVRERDAMRREMTIDVNGVNYPVIVDDGIYEQDSTNDANLNPGEFASSIYFVPITVNGGFPATYRQHVDYRLGRDDVSLLRGMLTFWTDAGVYSWALEQIKWCYKLTLKTEQRVVLRTPQLAGKIQNIKYEPLQHLRDPLPDSPYHVDGGASMRTLGTDYAVWL